MYVRTAVMLVLLVGAPIGVVDKDSVGGLEIQCDAHDG
jgi:hypothetical protein